MNKRVSLKDIAQKTGVSIALVSYVLNNKKEGRINKEVAQRIRDTAKALNYRTNQIAKSLKTNKTFTIGLIVADISNTFSSELARIIEDEADKHQYTVIFGSSDEKPEKFEKLAAIFVNRQVDGLIVAPPQDAEKSITDLQQQIPFVLIDRYFPGISANYILLDNYASAYEATEYLIRSGCKRPCLITYESSLFHLEERTRGFKEALQDHRILLGQNWLQKVAFANVKAEIEKVIDNILASDEPADAILFTSNSIAYYGVRYINRLPISVPRELSLITFDEPLALDLFYAPLTYIKQPLAEMGTRATQLLLDNIHHTQKPESISIKGQLIIRASTNQPLP